MIKNSNNGGMVVVQDATMYQAEALRHLSDEDIYYELNSDPTNDYKYILGSLVLKTQKEGENMVPSAPIVSVSPSPKDTQRFGPT